MVVEKVVEMVVGEDGEGDCSIGVGGGEGSCSGGGGRDIDEK